MCMYYTVTSPSELMLECWSDLGQMYFPVFVITNAAKLHEAIEMMDDEEEGYKYRLKNSHGQVVHI